MKSAELLNLILLILLAACVRENHLKRIWHSAHEILPVSDALSVSVNIRQDSISTNSPISRAPTTLSPPTRLCIAKSPLPRPWPATYCLHSEEDTPDLLRPNGNVTFTCEYEHIGELSTDVASWIGRFTRAGGLLNHWSLEDCELYNVTRAFDEEVAASERDEKLLSPANRFNRIAPPVPQYIHPIESAPLCTRAFLLTHMRLTNFFTNMNLVAPCPRARPIEYIWIYNVSLANKSSWSSWLQSYLDAGGTLVPGRYALVSMSLADDLLDGLGTLLQLLARSPPARPFELTFERMPRLEQMLTKIEQQGNQVALNLIGLHMQSSGLTRIPHAFKANVLDVVDLSFNNISKLLLNDLAFLRLANSTELHIEDSLLCLLEFQALLKVFQTGGPGSRAFLARNPVSDLGGLAQLGFLSDTITASDIKSLGLEHVVLDCCSIGSQFMKATCTVASLTTIQSHTTIISSKSGEEGTRIWVIVGVTAVIVVVALLFAFGAIFIFVIILKKKYNKTNIILDHDHEME